MNFHKHSDLIGEHAFLGGSKYHWINYDEDRLAAAYDKYMAVQRGIQLHDFAKRCIELGIKLPKSRKSLNQYVNDAIGYRMTPELVLYYSSNSFGTADSLSFRDNVLRIHDLKTGVSPVSMRQLEVYAALFCLEYSIVPSEIYMELRIYQMDTVLVHKPNPNEIATICNKIIQFDEKIEQIRRMEEEH